MSKDITPSTTEPLSKSEIALLWKRRRRRVGNKSAEVCPGITRVELTQGKSTVLDTEDWLRLNHIKWQAHKTDWGSYYATGAVQLPDGPMTVQMSRLVMLCPDDLEVDHRDGNTLDNRKTNLRCVSSRINCHNRHGEYSRLHVGVYWTDSISKWRCETQFQGKMIHLGVFTEFEDAVAAHQKAMREIESGCFTPPERHTSSDYRGISWHKQHEKWQAREPRTRKHLGYFENLSDAITALDRSRLENE